jgi:hypothetical protein
MQEMVLSFLIRMAFMLGDGHKDADHQALHKHTLALFKEGLALWPHTPIKINFLAKLLDANAPQTIDPPAALVTGDTDTCLGQAKILVLRARSQCPDVRNVLSAQHPCMLSSSWWHCESTVVLCRPGDYEDCASRAAPAVFAALAPGHDPYPGASVRQHAHGGCGLAKRSAAAALPKVSFGQWRSGRATSCSPGVQCVGCMHCFVDTQAALCHSFLQHMLTVL